MMESWTDTFWPDADLSNGWKYLAGLGAYYPDSESHYIYQHYFGWLYLYEIGYNSLWFQSADLGWFWTDPSIFPILWQENVSKWRYYETRKGTPRWWDWAHDQNQWQRSDDSSK